MIRKTNAKFRKIGRLGIAAVAVLRPDGDRIGAAGRHEEAPRLAVVTGDDDVRAVFTRSGRRREVVAPAASRTEAARRRRRADEAHARRLRSDLFQPNGSIEFIIRLHIMVRRKGLFDSVVQKCYGNRFHVNLFLKWIVNSELLTGPAPTGAGC